MLLRKTSRRDLLADRLATVLISGVGVGVLFAVLGILFFLVQSAWPLWKPEGLQKAFVLESLSGQTLAEDGSLPLTLFLRRDMACTVDLIETKNRRRVASFGVVLGADGQPSLAAAAQPGLECRGLGANALGVMRQGIAGNSVRFQRAELLLEREFLPSESLKFMGTAAIATLNREGFVVVDDGVFARGSPAAPVALVKPTLKGGETLSLPADVVSGSAQLAFQRLDEKHNTLVARRGASNPIFWAMTYTRESNALSGEVSVVETPLTDLARGGAFPLEVAWTASGTLLRFYADGQVAFRSPEGEGAVPLAGFPTLARVAPLVGGVGYFVDSGLGTCGLLDSSRLSLSGESLAPILWTRPCLGEKGSETHLAAHPRMRIVIQEAAGVVWAFETTTGRRMFRTSLKDLGVSSLLEVEGLAFSSEGNHLLLEQKGATWLAHLEAPHPEASLSAFFGKVFYEGYKEQGYTWQSTSGSEGFQPKFSLMPLIWGTLKACFYSMIFAVPMAVFSAIYSSEFLDRRTRNLVKPAVEMMASLPSVVLGFLAAIVVAPWVEKNVLGVVLCITGLPFALYFFGNLLSAYSARHISARGLFAANRLLFLYAGATLLSLGLLLQLGSMLERSAFGGDLKNYLAGGHGVEGVLWGILLLPLLWMTLWSLRVGHSPRAWRNLVFLVAPLLSMGLGFALASQGDIRANLLGSYAQRNTLVIAICMGFAVIPIIYSISEDALCAVPASLRAASLACGASVWQTTARVVIPTAASGIFSACIIGLGRAIGETMIVVMATGNTAVMSLNPFDGLRSLSANIAVEMPEAVQGSTHYRTLFFSALLLFGFTFVLNSLAEWIRGRYRARSQAL